MQPKITSFLNQKRHYEKEWNTSSPASNKQPKQTKACIPFLVILPQHLTSFVKTDLQLKALVSNPTPKSIKAFIQANIQETLKQKGTKVSIDKVSISNLEKIVSERFWGKAIPQMLQSAMSTLPEIESLNKNQNIDVRITRATAHAILAHMFFGTLPEQLFVDDCTLTFLMMESKYKHNGVRLEKLRCFIAYFQGYTLLSSQEKKQEIIFRRVYSTNKDYRSQNVKLCDVNVVKVPIQDQHMELMVDFANKRLGGGVLTDGAVQEEIMFCIFPELVIARLLCAPLNDNQAVIVQGFRRFSDYQGYSKTFTYIPMAKRDTSRGNVIIAIDAVDYSNFPENRKQFQKDCVDREIHKAYVGFSPAKILNDDKDIVSGKWGCGVFKGDSQVKFVIQWLVCSLIHSELTFVNWGPEEPNQDYTEMVSQLRRLGIQTLQLRQMLQKYNQFLRREDVQIKLFDYILEFYVQGGIVQEQSVKVPTDHLPRD